MGKGNESGSILSRKRLSDTLLDLNTLDCPICYEALTIPIFQCHNGHLACSSCCPKLSNKCPACALPIGHSRCRGLESVLGSIMVQCPNAKFGCSRIFSYGGESSTHENECNFYRSSCPVQGCNYTASYKDFYDHFETDHMRHCLYLFACSSPFSVSVHISNKILIVRELEMKLVFVLQCFREPYGVYVTVSCIAPPAPQVGEFSYRLSYTMKRHTLNYECPEVKRVLQVTFQTPKENFLLIPNSLLHGDMLSMKLCIKKLNNE